MRNALLEEFKDVFDTSNQLKTVLGELMKIHLNENVETFAISATRSNPFVWRDEVKANLDQMTSKTMSSHWETFPPDGVIRLW